MDLVCKVFLLAGLFFFTTATIGFLRFPDFYSRMHATGKGDTLGILLSLIGLAIYHLAEHHFSWPAIVIASKLILIAVFWFLGGPTATHALLRSAFDTGRIPWTKDGRPVIKWPPKEK
ncbi:Na(+)/H(+) antiporter subunit G1 [Candidatus Methanoperedenaceae archaeon GB50]|nr:monovalent cation/H(+) antiporter subunit G [Candidatus Desulfofervidus auxilii]CAD7778120.1 Na(+)/H(+) antiporter subunit G1 [Candidatus Methanoperedenaceae archaeon GB50]CAD7779236.1 Na(+)/H(+) antiporter subunit G1 [Candidatus Methanoperedenaceae archaeon GB37]